MTRNRFEKIKRFFHFVDNDCLPQRDKMSKIRSLPEAVNISLQLLQQFRVFAEDLSVDEHILVVIHTIPIRFGYKNWIHVLASSCNYPLKFGAYVGASEMRQDQSLDSFIASNLLVIIENPRQHCACFITSY